MCSLFFFFSSFPHGFETGLHPPNFLAPPGPAFRRVAGSLAALEDEEDTKATEYSDEIVCNNQFYCFRLYGHPNDATPRTRSHFTSPRMCGDLA